MIRYVLIGIVIGSLCFSFQAVQAQSQKQADQQLKLGKPDAPLCTVKGWLPMQPDSRSQRPWCI